jgi:site-specific recombinase XerD
LILPRSEWIEGHVSPEGRLRGAPLFVNPYSGNRWTPTSLRRTWERASRNAGVPFVPPYEGTKHSFATNALNRGVPLVLVKDMLGHSDIRSTVRYAKVRPETLIQALGPRLQPGYKDLADSKPKTMR